MMMARIVITSLRKSWSTKSRLKRSHEALGLGELEERIVDVSRTREIHSVGEGGHRYVDLFFLFIVVYTIVETLF